MITGDTIWRLLFWLSAGMVLYTYLVYPLLLLMLASLWQVWRDVRFATARGERRQRPATECLPSVSLAFAAHNEEAVIAEKMRNCAACDYPAERLEILVGCDACADDTPALARAAGLPNARVFDFRQRSGKLGVVNRLAEQARGEILVLSDASTFLTPGAIRSLVRHFDNPAVGCVCGELRLTPPQGGPASEGVYWRYEVFLKFLESRLGLLLGANGGVYAIRRELFEPLDRQAIIDDFLIAMRVRKRGYALVYDPEAMAFEESAPNVEAEFRRRVRIGAGNFHALRLTASLLSPFAGRVAFSYWSHKVFRWLVPFALPLAFVASLALSANPFYLAASVAMALAAAAAWAGWRADLRGRPSRWLCIPYYFFSMNLAVLIGFTRFLGDTQGSVWERTVRTEELPGVGAAGPPEEVSKKAAGGAS